MVGRSLRRRGHPLLLRLLLRLLALLSVPLLLCLAIVIKGGLGLSHRQSYCSGRLQSLDASHFEVELCAYGVEHRGQSDLQCSGFVNILDDYL